MSTEESISQLSSDTGQARYLRVCTKNKSISYSLHQAESILSNLRQRSKTLPAHATPPPLKAMSSGLSGLEGLNGLDQDQKGLVPSSDIEANIRKLENTQAKINAALEAFRSVKAGDNSPVMDFQSGNPAASMSRDRPLTVKNFEKQSSRTAPAKMRQNSFSTKSSDSSGNL